MYRPLCGCVCVTLMQTRVWCLCVGWLHGASRLARPVCACMFPLCWPQPRPLYSLLLTLSSIVSHAEECSILNTRKYTHMHRVAASRGARADGRWQSDKGRETLSSSYEYGVLYGAAHVEAAAHTRSRALLWGCAMFLPWRWGERRGRAASLGGRNLAGRRRLAGRLTRGIGPRHVRQRWGLTAGQRRQSNRGTGTAAARRSAE